MKHQGLTAVLCVIWAATLLYGEMFAFWVPSLGICSWPHHHLRPSTHSPYTSNSTVLLRLHCSHVFIRFRFLIVIQSHEGEN